MKLDVLLRITSAAATTRSVRWLGVVLLLRTVVRDGVLDRTLDVGLEGKKGTLYKGIVSWAKIYFIK